MRTILLRPCSLSRPLHRHFPREQSSHPGSGPSSRPGAPRPSGCHPMRSPPGPSFSSPHAEHAGILRLARSPRIDKILEAARSTVEVCSCALDQGMKVSSIRHTPARVMRMQPASKSTFPASQVLDDDIFQWLGWASSSVVPEATPPASSSRCRSQSGRNRLAAAQEGLSRR